MYIRETTYNEGGTNVNEKYWNDPLDAEITLIAPGMVFSSNKEALEYIIEEGLQEVYGISKSEFKLAFPEKFI